MAGSGRLKWPAARRPVADQASARMSSVRGQGSPSSYLSRTWPKTRSALARAAKRDMREQALRTSGLPRISRAVRPWTSSRAWAHARNRAPQQGMIEKGGRFGAIWGGVELGHSAGTQAQDAGKDEPYPVRSFMAGPQSGQCPIETYALGIDEPVQVVPIDDWHGHSCFFVRFGGSFGRT